MTTPSIKPSIEHVPADALGVVFAYVGERGAIPRVCRQWERVFDSSETTYQILWAIKDNSKVSRLLSREIKEALQNGSEVISDTELRKEVQRAYQKILIFAACQGDAFESIIKYARERLGGDPMIALALNTTAFQEAHEVCNNDWRFHANKQRELLPPQLEYVFNNPKFWLRAVSKNPNFLALAGPRFQDDREIVLVAIKRDTYALQYASPDLQNDLEIVKLAVTEDGRALEFASDDLKDDLEVVNLAVTCTHYSIKYASNRLQREFRNNR